MICSQQKDGAMVSVRVIAARRTYMTVQTRRIDPQASEQGCHAR
jgi:hypothetical protein